MKEALHGKECFVVKRCLKLINSRLDSIMKQKGCDASNMFDEELGQDEQEFSDDDAEKAVVLFPELVLSELDHGRAMEDLRALVAMEKSKPFFFKKSSDPADVIGSGGEIWMVEDFLLERDGGLDAVDSELPKGALHPCDGDLAGGSGDD